MVLWRMEARGDGGDGGGASAATELWDDDGGMIVGTTTVGVKEVVEWHCGGSRCTVWPWEGRGGGGGGGVALAATKRWEYDGGDEVVAGEMAI
eukprot:scaffold22773_cov35-Cyclotella_meneghiniana.AAC.5